MRYHYEQPKTHHSMYGECLTCNHPVYNSCTLYKIGDKGIAVIQQRFRKEDKSTYWTDIDPWLTDEIYLHSGFKAYFDKRASSPIGGLYPTVTIRQIMWSLKMKPLKKERWETTFDRRNI